MSASELLGTALAMVVMAGDPWLSGNGFGFVWYTRGAHEPWMDTD
jgi:hypothetical protein